LTDVYKIYVDPTQPATLNNGAGVLTDCPTLGEAVMEWHSVIAPLIWRGTTKVSPTFFNEIPVLEDELGTRAGSVETLGDELLFCRRANSGDWNSQSR
jgi:hypothetical protein